MTELVCEKGLLLESLGKDSDEERKHIPPKNPLLGLTTLTNVSGERIRIKFEFEWSENMVSS